MRPHVTPPAAQIDLARYPAVGDQGQLGACAAWAAAWALSYEYRETHPRSALRFSPRYLYDHYSLTYSGGQDSGSWPDQDLETVPVTGAPQYNAWPEPPVQIDSSLDPSIIDAWHHPLGQDAARHVLPVTVQHLSGDAQGEGQGLVDAIRATVSGQGTADGKAHPVMIGFPVWSEYDNARYQPRITSPTPAEEQAAPFGRGGHENVIVAYDDALTFPDGTIGGAEVQNQWTTQWGQAGRAWLSYDFLRRFAFGAEYLTVAKTSAFCSGVFCLQSNPPPMWAGMTHTPKPAPPSPPLTSTQMRRVMLSSDVHGVYARDRSLDLSPLINAAAHAYGLPAWGLTSTLGAECGLNTGEPTGQVYDDCARYGAWPDVSFGACQVTVSTAGGYGVGSSSADGGNVQGVHGYENQPAQCIDLAARIMSAYIRYTGIGYPFAEVAWNCGPAYGFIANPQGQCYSNFQQYLGWYRWALTKAGGGPVPQPPKPPKPRPVFHRAQWGPHTPYYHGALSWCASVWVRHQSLGRYLGQRWYPRRHHGFTDCRFRSSRGRIGHIYTWPSFRRTRVAA